MYNRKSSNSLFNRLISVFVVFALFIGIFPARIIHAEQQLLKSNRFLADHLFLVKEAEESWC